MHGKIGHYNTYILPGRNRTAYIPPQVPIDFHLWGLLSGLDESVESYKDRKKQGVCNDCEEAHIKNMETELGEAFEEVKPLTEGKGWCYEVVFSALYGQYKGLRRLPNRRVGIGTMAVSLYTLTNQSQFHR